MTENLLFIIKIQKNSKCQYELSKNIIVFVLEDKEINQARNEHGQKSELKSI